MPQCHGVGQGDISSDAGRDGSSHLGHLEGVGQAGALVISGMDDDLGLACQSPERRRVDDPVPIPLEAGPLGIRLLRDGAVPCAVGTSGSRTQEEVLPLLPNLPSDDLSGLDSYAT